MKNPIKHFFSTEAAEGYVPNRELLCYATALAGQNMTYSLVSKWIFYFCTNILLALILSFPMGGNGIALALSLASLLNTVFLFIFMKKMAAIEVERLARGTLLYGLKMLLLSVIAAAPTCFVHKALCGILTVTET